VRGRAVAICSLLLFAAGCVASGGHGLDVQGTAQEIGDGTNLVQLRGGDATLSGHGPNVSLTLDRVQLAVDQNVTVGKLLGTNGSQVAIRGATWSGTSYDNLGSTTLANGHVALSVPDCRSVAGCQSSFISNVRGNGSVSANVVSVGVDGKSNLALHFWTRLDVRLLVPDAGSLSFLHDGPGEHDILPAGFDSRAQVRFPPDPAHLEALEVRAGAAVLDASGAVVHVTAGANATLVLANGTFVYDGDSVLFCGPKPFFDLGPPDCNQGKFMTVLWRGDTCAAHAAYASGEGLLLGNGHLVDVTLDSSPPNGTKVEMVAESQTGQWLYRYARQDAADSSQLLPFVEKTCVAGYAQPADRTWVHVAGPSLQACILVDPKAASIEVTTLASPIHLPCPP